MPFLVTKIGKGGERTVGGCCVVPSDWEGQTAGQAAAAAALMDLLFIDNGKINTP